MAVTDTTVREACQVFFQARNLYVMWPETIQTESNKRQCRKGLGRLLVLDLASVKLSSSLTKRRTKRATLT
jgi:hypothetical protein